MARQTKEVDKRSVVVRRDKDEYLNGNAEQLSCKEMYGEVIDELSYLNIICIGH